MVEIGAVKHELDMQHPETLQSLVYPNRRIPLSASTVHGLTDKDVLDAPAAEIAIPRLVEFLSSTDIVFGFNTPFDARFLVHECLLIQTPPPDIQFLDVKRLAGQLGYGNLSLAALSEKLGVQDNIHAHRAVSDALQTGECLVRLLRTHFSPRSMLSEVLAVHNRSTPPYTTQRAIESVEQAHQKHTADLREEVARQSFCVTGKIPGYSRAELKQQLNTIGCKYTKEVTSATDFIVVGVSRMVQRKLDDAEALGTPVMTAEQFTDWLKAHTE